MEKMKVSEQAAIRAKLYDAAGTAIKDCGYTTETIADGMLIHLGDGQYGKVKISICDPSKFNLEAVREEYAKKTAMVAERAEKARQKAEEKERKAKERAVKAAEKTPSVE